MPVSDCPAGWLASQCARARLRLGVLMFWSAGRVNDMLNIVDCEAAAVFTRGHPSDDP